MMLRSGGAMRRTSRYAGDIPKREAQGLQKEDPQEAVRPGGTKERPPRSPTEAESLLVGNQFLRNCKIARRRIYSWKLMLLNSTSTFFDSFRPCAVKHDLWNGVSAGVYSLRDQ
jgi:hypothetical protein